jgi:hypothetical protein
MEKPDLKRPERFGQESPREALFFLLTDVRACTINSDSV